MKFDLKNIGPIKEASIKVDGLTVIAGENSIGKSFISKTIFCIIKGVRNLQNNSFSEEQYKELQSLVFDLLATWEEEDNAVELYNYLGKLVKKYMEMTKKISSDKEFSELFNFIKTTEKAVIELVREKYNKLSVYDNFESQRKFLNNFLKEKTAKDTIDELINYVFNNHIKNKNGIDECLITMLSKDEKLEVIIEPNHRIIESNNIKTIKGSIDSKYDISIIESPLILTNYKFIRDSLAFNRGDIYGEYLGLSYQTFDLVKKIASKGSYNKKLHKNIDNIISGQMTFDTFEDDFIFIDKNKNKHNINNVASGIKSFGLLQLLLNSGNLNENSILIIDEPEVHLHPFWQIEYAKVLVKLAENDIPVIVASHSPYFIEALKTYSDKAIKDKTNFYLGEMQEGGSVFKDVTDDLEPIFELLSIPMQQLMLDNH